MRRYKDTLFYFGTPYLLFFITTITLLTQYDKKDLHLLLNSYHTPFLDTFFKYITEMGGTFIVVILLSFLLYQYRVAILTGVTLLFNLLLTNSLKLYFKVPRPSSFFEQNYPDITLPYVDGIRMYTSNSFPSGHTSAVFAMMLILALCVKNRIAKTMACIVAILVGYSRIYLSQHFASDVLAGSLAGMVSAVVIYSLFQRFAFSRSRWMYRSVLSHFKKV